MPPTIVLTPKQVFTWDIPSMKEVTPEHLKIIEIMNPAPEYVILGCMKVTDVSEEVRKYLISLGINYDVVEMVMNLLFSLGQFQTSTYTQAMKLK